MVLCVLGVCLASLYPFLHLPGSSSQHQQNGVSSVPLLQDKAEEYPDPYRNLHGDSAGTTDAAHDCWQVLLVRTQALHVHLAPH